MKESPIPSPDSGGGETYVRCPEGKHCRLIVEDENETLVYCEPLEPGECAHVVLFEGTRFCGALLGSKKRRPESSVAEESAHRLPTPTAGAPGVDPKKLTPEEQMALFAKDLKEKDWGHQPC